MPQFTIRVALPDDATPADQTALDGLMREAGFGDLIRGDDGRTYSLPRGEYHGFGDGGIHDCLAIAQQAATGLGKPFSLLVTEGDNRLWSGLDVVETRQA